MLNFDLLSWQTKHLAGFERSQRDHRQRESRPVLHRRRRRRQDQLGRGRRRRRPLEEAAGRKPGKVRQPLLRLGLRMDLDPDERGLSHRGLRSVHRALHHPLHRRQRSLHGHGSLSARI